MDESNAMQEMQKILADGIIGELDGQAFYSVLEEIKGTPNVIGPYTAEEMWDILVGCGVKMETISQNLQVKFNMDRNITVLLVADYIGENDLCSLLLRSQTKHVIEFRLRHLPIARVRIHVLVCVAYKNSRAQGTAVP